MTVERIHFATLPSTQTEAKSHFGDLKTGQWRVYTAGEQSAGYGTHGRTWNSPQGNIYASYICLLPEKAQKILSYIPYITAVSLIRVLQQKGVSPTIKWVNDILLDRKKIAGILTQVEVIDRQFAICIGIGMNINSEAAVLTSVKQPATSLRAITGKTYDLDELILLLSNILKRNVMQCIEKGSAAFQSEMIQNLERFGDLPVIFDTEQQPHRYHIGRIAGINEKGELQLQNESKAIDTFMNGRILRGKEIEEVLTDQVLSALIKWHHFETVASMQNYARENFCSTKEKFWHAITAASQVEGIGRAGRTWQSFPDHLYATFVLPKPTDFKVTKMQLSEVIAFSVVAVLRNYKIDAAIQWKNDVQVGEKRISGIFVELNEGSILIGIRINMNENSSRILDQETTSIKNVLKIKGLSVEDLFFQLQRELYLNIELLWSYGFSYFLPQINDDLRYKETKVTIVPEEGELV